MMLGTQVELLADPVHLVLLRGGQVIPVVGEDRRRIVHRLVEDMREEIVAEVVVSRALAFAARSGAPRHQQAEPLETTSEELDPAARSVKPRQVEPGDRAELDQIVTVPLLAQVTVREPGAASEHPPPELR